MTHLMGGVSGVNFPKTSGSVFHLTDNQNIIYCPLPDFNDKSSELLFNPPQCSPDFTLVYYALIALAALGV